MPASTTAGTPPPYRSGPLPTPHTGPVPAATFCFRTDCPHARSSPPRFPPGPVSVRSHPAPEAPGNSIGLEAIIRKALMGKYDDQSEERSPSNPAASPLVSSIPAGPIGDGRPEDFGSQGRNRSASPLFLFLYGYIHPAVQTGQHACCSSSQYCYYYDYWSPVDNLCNIWSFCDETATSSGQI